MYQYWGFGLHIACEFEFPELLPFPFTGDPDVTITKGITPPELKGDAVVKRPRMSMGPGQYLLEVPGIANYYVANGNEITVDFQAGGDEGGMRLFLLSNAMAAVLYQQNRIPLHASAVYYKQGILLFCGHSGAGKSTTATALQLKGYKIFSDDVCVLKKAGDGQLVVLPSYPMTKLWEDGFDKMGIVEAEKRHRLRPNLAKYGRLYHDEFSIAQQTVNRIFILDTDEQLQAPVIKKMGKIEAFRELQRNTYRNGQMRGMQKRNIHFSLVAQLAASAPVYKITRPKLGNFISQVTGLIESCLHEMAPG